VGTKKRVNKYPRAFQRMALERMKNCESVSELAEELGIHRTVLYHWKNHLKAMEGGAADSPMRELRKQVRDLKRVPAEKTLEVDFFKGALQKIEAQRQGSSNSGATASTSRSGK
jgi:transposase